MFITYKIFRKLSLERCFIHFVFSVYISENPSQFIESELLASDSEESKDEPAEKLSRVFVRGPRPQSNDDFYIDRKLDRGNLRVSTLYYPGRPQYVDYLKYTFINVIETITFLTFFPSLILLKITESILMGHKL